MKKLILFLTFIIVNLSTSGGLSIATIRYVSHSGTNTPPYLTWETAADSIMSAINISSFGDTIYVANGVYEEQVVMISGLSLIGAGMDSCIIDTHNLVTSQNYPSVKIADNCLLTEFHIIIYNNYDKGVGIAMNVSAFNSTITLNKISNGYEGIYVGNKPYIYKNIINKVTTGIGLFNSNSVVRKNTIYTDPNSDFPIVDGIDIEAFDYTYKPIIDSNIIFPLNAWGIDKSFGATPTISNNMIILDSTYVGAAMSLYLSDTVKVFNNLIWGYGSGIYTEGGSGRGMNVYNNFISGNIEEGIISGPSDSLKNNVISNADIAIKKWFNQPPPVVKFNNFWKDSIKYSGFTNTDTTNISVNPMVINDDSTKGELDFHLQMFSPLIDRGDPSILDKDSSRSDIGLYGGPFGESYKYVDLPPRTPVNFTVVLDTNDFLLTWNKNTEADFSHYNLYRDTTENFTIDSTTFVVSIDDTFYLHIIPPGITNLYFKVTAIDNQGNQSEPSEEKHIILSGTISNRQLTINNYQLYQNYPNPFNPSTKIGYRLKEKGYVKLYVYDIKGELVETLVNNYQEGEYYEVEFNGKINNHKSSIDNSLASGVYIYQIMVRNDHNIPVFSDIKKMIFLK